MWCFVFLFCPCILNSSFLCSPQLNEQKCIFLHIFWKTPYHVLKFTSFFRFLEGRSTGEEFHFPPPHTLRVDLWRFPLRQKNHSFWYYIYLWQSLDKGKKSTVLLLTNLTKKRKNKSDQQTLKKLFLVKWNF